MLNPKSLLPLFFVGLLFASILPLMAQPSNRSGNDHAIPTVSFKPPPNEGKPDQTSGAGSRQDNQCFQDTTSVSTIPEHSLMPLVPTSNYGLTVTERPTFLIALSKTTAKQLILSIKENGTIHHSQTVLSLKDSSGIISVSPSENSPPLEIGKEYQWSVVLVCGEKPRPDDPAIASWVRRVAPPQAIPSKLNQENALTQARWYGEQGLWYDALLALVEAKRSQPESEEMTEIWSNFLASVGLQEISSRPLRF
ncbi:DUF928 domain-containing protein [Chroococcus sp. FPU101]|uniref:DUF928 domain-containing protein n=1 Tax=Chroococcus sp. FPU101 TaxID=1974212 RepID=UPI001A8E24F2|nr:DUF928 domain-containing protein [Chroococcus sp. FPU101]GFE69529.1 protein of unknown function DUF928 [Chroococcus sp. FPU101]